MQTNLPSLSLRDLDLCHEICLHLLSRLLKSCPSPSSQPSSLASTPSTPVPPSGSTRSLGSTPLVLPLANLMEPLSSLTVQIYDAYLAFFSEFLEERFMPEVTGLKYSVKQQQVSFASACHAVLLVSQLIHKADVASEGKEKSEISSGNRYLVSSTFFKKTSTNFPHTQFVTIKLSKRNYLYKQHVRLLSSSIIANQFSTYLVCPYSPVYTRVLTRDSPPV